MNISDKLTALRTKLTEPSDLATVTAWEKKVRTAMLNDDLSKHDGVKIILEELEKRVDQCNLVLRDDRELTEADRKTIFTKRDCWEWLIRLFDSSQKTLENMESRINQELSRLTDS